MDDKTTWNEFTYRTNDGAVKTIRVPGHNILVRKCLLPDSAVLAGPPTAESDRFGDTMLASLKHHMHQNVCEVLAVGEDVGKLRKKKARRSKGIAANYVIELKPGDRVVMPERSNHMYNGVVEGDLDYLIADDSIVIAKVE